MIQVTPHMRILVAVDAADFRRGIDGLARLCRDEIREDPFSGCLFVFRNRSATAIKCLVYDGGAFWLCYRRLSTGRYRFWPKGGDEGGAVSLEVHQVQLLLYGGDPTAGNTVPPPWRRLAAVG
ncbi:MAG: IS66 family insertion sequence element accessory protein TnpB [bacterium]